MPLTIGQAAARSACSPPTIRYYEDIGLLRPVGRTPNGRRAYTIPEVHRLTFIRRARDLGLSVEQVRTLLRLSDGDPAECASARDLVEEHLAAVRTKRAELALLEASLARMAQRCDSICASDPDVPCTMFEDVIANPVTSVAR